MNIKKLTKLAGIIAVVLGLSACGGGGGSETASTVSVGTITGFGSVFVNGVEFETDNASIIIDGSSASESDLFVGMVAKIKGSANGSIGTALKIEVSDELEGVVQNNSIPSGGNSGTMVIMGQTVTIDANTIFDSNVAGVTSVDQIAAGNIVEVNGYSDGTGNIFATRIEVKAVDMASYGGSIEVKGVIDNLNTVNQTFDLGNLVIDYSIAIIDDFTLAKGLYVEVKSDTAPVDSTLVASRIELEDDGEKGEHGDSGKELEIKGIVASVHENSFLLMDGTLIITDSNTEFDDDSHAKLIAGVMVEVHGRFNADGELLATEVSIEDDDASDQSEYSGLVIDVTTTDVNTGTVTLEGGKVFMVSNTTIMKDSSSDGVHRFNLQQLEMAWKNGEKPYVEINAFTDTTTENMIAVKLERDDEPVSPS